MKLLSLTLPRLVSVLLALGEGATLPRATATPTLPEQDMQALIYGVPKTELHIHFEGTLVADEYIEFNRRNHITDAAYKTSADVRQRQRQATSFATFIVIYEELVHSLRTAQDFHDTAMAYFTKAHSQGVVYVEMFFDPQLHVIRGIPLATVMAGLTSARSEAREKLGLRVNYIMCFNRNRSAESATALLEASRPWSDCIIGIGLDNPEELNFPTKFAAVYARARDLGFHLTSHCDVDQINTLGHIRGCLDVLKVERIDHGLNVLDDPRLVEAVRDRHIGLTGCVTQFYVPIPGRVAQRAGMVKRLLDLNVLICLNSDDPGMLAGNYVGDCFRMTQEAAQLSRDQILTLVKNGFKIAWLSNADRSAYLKAVEAFAAKYPAQ